MEVMTLFVVRSRVQQWWDDVRHLPLVTGAGLLVFATGGAGDLLYHALPAETAAQLVPALGINGTTPHLVTFVGMVLLLVGVIRQGLGSRGALRTSRRLAPPAQRGLTLHSPGRMHGRS
jgi:hypothetical protein